MWQAVSGYGDSVVYLDGSGSGQGVCAPVVPAGTIAPTVNSALCQQYFLDQGSSTFRLRRGRYYVTLYASAFSQLSLVVNTAGATDANAAVPLRAVPRTILADGQPLYLQTGPITMCPGSVRSNVTEACPGDPGDGSVSNVTQGSISVFRIPGGAPITFVNVVVERLCGGNATGDCGTELYIAINGCPFGNCTSNQLTPYGSDAYFAYREFFSEQQCSAVLRVCVCVCVCVCGFFWRVFFFYIH